MTTTASDKAETGAKFFAALAETGNVSQSCKAAEVSRATVHRWRDGDIEFATAWDAALEKFDAADTAALDEEDDAPAPAAPVVQSWPGARYRLTEQAFIDDRLCEPDTIVEYSGIPGHHMLPMNAEARAAKGLAPGAIDIEAIEQEAADFVNDAATRAAVLEGEITKLNGRLLIARGSQFGGSPAQQAAARAEANALLVEINQKQTELLQTAPMIEQAQAMVDGAGAKARAQANESALAEIEPRNAIRVAYAQQAEAYAMLAAQCLCQVLSMGEDVWARVRLNTNENSAQSCVPDPNAVAKALVGALLRSGLSLDGIVQLSELGLNGLRTFEPVSEIVRRQNDALVSRLQ